MTQEPPFTPAPIPANDSERLKTLESYDILDSLPEQEYEDLALLASQICEVPVALISFVGGERQWFKAAVGIELNESPREVSFCGHAIVNDEPLIVQNALEDERFAGNPFVADDPNVRFYAGFQIRSHDGSPLGTICTLDVQPRQLTEQQERAMQALARQVSSLLELRLKQNNSPSAMLNSPRRSTRSRRPTPRATSLPTR